VLEARISPPQFCRELPPVGAQSLQDVFQDQFGRCTRIRNEKLPINPLLRGFCSQVQSNEDFAAMSTLNTTENKVLIYRVWVGDTHISAKLTAW
jgi:hypothetical protein